MPTTKKIIDGSIKGTVSGEPTTWAGERRYGTYFSIILDEKIEGIPHEIEVKFSGALYVRKGDEVEIIGELIEEFSKTWNRSIFKINAQHVYNHQLQSGY